MTHLATVLATDKEEMLRKEGTRIFREFIQPEQLVGDVYSLNYESALVQIHDRFRQQVGGIPGMCLLLATRINPEKEIDFREEDSNLILLRVLDSAPLPNAQEAERIRVEVGQRVAGRGAFELGSRRSEGCRNRQSAGFAGVRCRILGTFLFGKERNEKTEKLELRFGCDIPNFYPNQGLKVFKPNSAALQKIVNFRESNKSTSANISSVPVGQVRYASTDRNFQNATDVSFEILPEDLLAQKTALFGITRSGKSNTTKIIIKSVHEMRYLPCAKDEKR